MLQMVFNLTALCDLCALARVSLKYAPINFVLSLLLSACDNSKTATRIFVNFDIEFY